MAMLLPVAMAVGTGLKAIGSVAEGNAKSAAYKGEAKSHDYNARVADLNAGMSYEQGSQQEEQARRDSRQQLGEQRAAVAQSGTGFGGSNADVIRQSTTNAEMDALNIRYGADVEAVGYKNTAQAERYNAALSRNAAKSAKKSGYLNATANIIGGVTDYARGRG